MTQKSTVNSSDSTQSSCKKKSSSPSSVGPETDSQLQLVKAEVGGSMLGLPHSRLSWVSYPEVFMAHYYDGTRILFHISQVKMVELEKGEAFGL